MSDLLITHRFGKSTVIRKLGSSRRRRAVVSYDLYERRLRLSSQSQLLLNRVTLSPGVVHYLAAPRNDPPVAMAVRGCVTLLLFLLSGTYHYFVEYFISDGVTLQKQILKFIFERCPQAHRSARAC